MDKQIIFLTALMDAYRNEDDRQLQYCETIDTGTSDASEDFLAMFWAMHTIYVTLTGQQVDQLEFINILTRLLFEDKLKSRDTDKTKEEDSNGDL